LALNNPAKFFFMYIYNHFFIRRRVNMYHLVITNISDVRFNQVTQDALKHCFQPYVIRSERTAANKHFHLLSSVEGSISHNLGRHIRRICGEGARWKKVRISDREHAEHAFTYISRKPTNELRNSARFKSGTQV
jgi:hypothetical protein